MTVVSAAQESNTVIASVSDLSAVAQRAKAEAIQDRKEELDCFVASAPRDGVDDQRHNPPSRDALRPSFAHSFAQK